MDAPIGFVTTADGVRIAHCALGDGPPLVLVRAWITHLELMWEEPAFRQFFEALARHHRIVRYDGRGNGLSDRDVARPSFDDLVADLEAIMDGLGIEHATLFGSTFGGPIAVAYADRHPERVDRLVLEGTFASGRETLTPDQQRSFATFLSTIDREPEMTFAAFSYQTDPNPTTPHERRVERAMRSITPEFAAYLYALSGEFDVTDELRRLDKPTLVLHRRESRVVSFEAGRRLAALVPGARFVSLEGGAHNAWDRPAGTALRAIREFLGTDPGPDFGPDVGTAPFGRAPAQPGPVTLLVTDLVASTALTGALGDAGAQELLRFHNATVRDALDAHAGREVKHTGDGILARFGSPAQAVACAIAVQDRFAERNQDAPDSALLVRIGINAGEPIEEDDDVFGTAVQLAARICAAAEPGEIVVSNVVRELTAGKGFGFANLGEATLRGFREPVSLYAVVHS